jgi:hypothetical protein
VSGFNILDHYWIFGDVNPTTQVYSSAVGAMVANNAAAYLTWLAGLDYTSDGGSGNGLPISNVENNGFGACRVTINTTAEMATGQRWRLAGVQGVPGANGTFQITVVNSTKIDLVGSTFSGAYTSGGFVLGPTFAATAASLAQVLNSAALESLVPSSNDITSAVNVTLSNPLSATTKVNITATGKAVTLPPMDRANSYPLNEPFTVINSGANAWDLKTNAGTTLGTLAPQASWQLKNTSNASAAGSFEIIITLYNSGTQGILQVAPKTDSAAAQGDWTNLAHQSNPGQFDGRNNEVWGFGYNLGNNWSSRNGLDDGIGMGWETHYHPSSAIGPQFEAHICRVGKKAGGEFRPLSFFIQKWDTTASVGAYWTAGTALCDEFTINRPSNNVDVFRFNTHQVGIPTSAGQAFFNDAPLFLQGDTLTSGSFLVFNQQNASFDILTSYRFSGADKWRTSVRKTTFNFDLIDDVAGAIHTTWYSNGGMAIGAPTGGDKGIGKLNAQGLFVNGNELLAELYLGLVNPILNPSGQVIDKALAAVSNNNYTWTPWIALSQGGNITPSQLTDVENGMPFMMRFAQAGANRFGAIQPIRSELAKYYRGQQVTIAARVRINTAHTIRFAVIEWSGTADGPTTDVVNDWASGTFTAGNFFKSTNLTITGTGSVTPGTSTLATASLTVTLGSSLTNLLIFFWADSAGAAHLDIGRVQLVPGSSAALLPPRPQGIEKSLLDELFQDYDVFSTNSSVSVGQAYSTTQALAALVFRKKFAKTPTGSVSAGSDFACVNATASAANACTTVAFSGTTKTNTRLDFSGSSGLVAGNCTMIQLNGAASDAKIYLDGRITPT